MIPFLGKQIATKFKREKKSEKIQKKSDNSIKKMYLYMENTHKIVVPESNVI